MFDSQGLSIGETQIAESPGAGAPPFCPLRIAQEGGALKRESSGKAGL